MELKKVIVIFRHGARTYVRDLQTAENVIPSFGKMTWDKETFSTSHISIEDKFVVKSEDETNDSPHSDQSQLEGGCFHGEITTIGQSQAKEFGDWLRRTYIDEHKLINEKYTSSQNYLRSTNMRRTILTLMSVFDGLFKQPSLDIDEKPVIITRSLKTEFIVPHWERSWIENVFRDRFSLFPHRKNLLEELEKHAEVGLMDAPNILVSLNDVIASRKAHDMFIPKYVSNFEDDIERGAYEIFGKVLEGENGIDTLWLGVGKFLDHLCDVIIHERSEKLYLYSGHDVTLIVLAKAFESVDNEWPGFCASFCIEVYTNNDGEDYIRILYEKNVWMFKEDGKQIEYIPVHKFFDRVKKHRWTERTEKENQIYNTSL